MLTIATDMDESQRKAAEDTLLFMVLIPAAMLCLLVGWVITSALAAASLRKRPRLLTQMEHGWKSWCALVWVPYVGPLAYAVLALHRHHSLTHQERRESRMPFRPATFTPYAPPASPPRW